MVMEKANHNPPGGFTSRSIAAAVFGLGIISGAVYLFNFKLPELVPALLPAQLINFYVVMSVFLSVLYLLGTFLVVRFNQKVGTARGLTGIILFFALIFRILLIPAEPTVLSNDMYRYIWDGRVQQKKINPFIYPPAAEELKELRDDRIFPHLNRKDSPTIYPAGAQIFFRIFYTLFGDSVRGFKGIMVFFDILAILILTSLLGRYGFEPARIIVYAWNPLVIFEIAYSGHLEGLTVFLVAASIYLSTSRKSIPGAILLAIAGAVKLYPALLLAAILDRGHRIKGALTFCITFAALYIPYISAGNKISGFLPIYLRNPYESFNLGLKYLLMRLIPGLDYYLISQFFILALLAVGLFFFFKEKQGALVIRYAYLLTGSLILLMPASLHPWYVILVVPFLVFYPNPAWLLFTCTVALSYLKYVSPQGIMPTWILAAEYLPLFVLLTVGPIFSKIGAKGWAGGDFGTVKAKN
jgi:hypothetical protein